MQQQAYKSHHEIENKNEVATPKIAEGNLIMARTENANVAHNRLLPPLLYIFHLSLPRNPNLKFSDHNP
jgi:hypothetical protein